VIVHVVGQLVHQRSVNLLELAQRFLAGFKDWLLACLPPFELAGLARSLLAVDMEQLSRDLELLALHFELLALDLEGLALKIGQQVKEQDRVVRVRDSTGWFLPRWRDLHAVGPGRGGGGWIFSR